MTYYEQLHRIHLAAAKLQADEELRSFLGNPLASGLLRLMKDAQLIEPERMLDRIADLAKLVAAASSTPPGCDDHRLMQHRDRLPPWCPTCRRTRWGLTLQQAREEKQ